MEKADSGTEKDKGKGREGIMSSKQISIDINVLAESIRQRYNYKSVFIDRIWAGTPSINSGMKNIEIGPGGVLNITISVKEKPPCTEICADPNMISVVSWDGGNYMPKETEQVRQRERKRIATCSLKETYRCKRN